MVTAAAARPSCAVTTTGGLGPVAHWLLPLGQDSESSVITGRPVTGEAPSIRDDDKCGKHDPFQDFLASKSTPAPPPPGLSLQKPRLGGPS